MSEIFTDKASAFWLDIARMFYYSSPPPYENSRGQIQVDETYKTSFGIYTLHHKTKLIKTVKALDGNPDNLSGFYFPRLSYSFAVDDLFTFTFYTETKAAYRAIQRPFRDLTIQNPRLRLRAGVTKDMAIDMMEINWKLASKPWIMKAHYYQ